MRWVTVLAPLRIFMAEEFTRANDAQAKAAVESVLGDVSITFEAHDALKLRVPQAIGLIRTGDTTQYSNIILAYNIPPPSFLD